MQRDLTILKEHALVSETIDGLLIKVRYQDRRAPTAVALLSLLSVALYGVFVWMEGWSVEAGLLLLLLAVWPASSTCCVTPTRSPSA